MNAKRRRSQQAPDMSLRRVFDRSVALARLRWEFERYDPIAFTVYSGLTPTLRTVDAPARMPAARLIEREIVRLAEQ